MSDISIPGVSSKYNTTKLVEDLVDAERIRLTRMEEQATELEELRSTWRKLNQDFSSLQRSAKSLYGFENPFSEKNAFSSNERILTATANRTAPFDTYSITVKQIATADRFITPSLDGAYRVKPGTYSFRVGDNEVSLRYRGGSLEDFARRLSEKGEGLIRAATIRDTPKTRVLMIEAIPTGSANQLIFADDAVTLGLHTGMMRKVETIQSQASLPANPDNVQTDTGASAPPGTVELAGESVIVRPSASLGLPFDSPIEVTEGMVLEYTYRTIEFDDDDLAPPVPPGPLWPKVPSGSFRGLTVESMPNSFVIPSGGDWTPPEHRDDWEVFRAKGKTVSPLPSIRPSKDFQIVQVEAHQLPSRLESLLLSNDNTHRAIEVKNVRLYNPRQQRDIEPSQPVDNAGDAIIEFRGIEARRPSNDISDLVDGLTISLKRPSDDPVDLIVEADTEAAKEGIIRFVFAYNQLLTRILVLTNDDPAVVDELEYLDDEERQQMESQLGSLRGDLSLNQAKNRLQSITSNPYPTQSDSNLNLLVQIGVSTNASSGSLGGSLDFSKLRGYLEIDEEKLDTVLQQDIDAVKELFGQDTNGDLIIDSGVAQSIDEYLTSYTQTGGLINTRISGIDGQIENKQEDITDYEEHLEEFEANLRRQYGNMEAMLNQLERSSQELNNFNKQQNSR